MPKYYYILVALIVCLAGVFPGCGAKKSKKGASTSTSGSRTPSNNIPPSNDINPGPGLGEIGTNEIVIATGKNPTALAVGDVNRDGSPDFVVANYRNPPQVLISDHAGKYRDESTTRIDQSWSMPAVALQLADCNRDGTPDLVIGGYSHSPEQEISKLFAIFSNDGSGKFSDVGFNLPGPKRAILDILVTEFDRQGGPDLVVTSVVMENGTSFLGSEIYLNNGNFTFTLMHPTANSSIGLNPRTVVMGARDLNGDGCAELLVREGRDSFLYDNRTLANAGLRFEKLPDALESTENAVIGRGDFGYLGVDVLIDLVAERVPAGEVSEAFFLRGLNSNGSSSANYSPWAYFPQNATSTPLFKKDRDLFEACGMIMGDLDGDGKLDLVTANKDKGKTSYYRNKGDDTFEGRIIGTGNPSPRSLHLADLNSDGKIDVIILNGGSGIKILLNDGKLAALTSSKKWYQQKWVKYAGVAVLVGAAWYLIAQKGKKKSSDSLAQREAAQRADRRRQDQTGTAGLPPIPQRQPTETGAASVSPVEGTPPAVTTVEAPAPPSPAASPSGVSSSPEGGDPNPVGASSQESAPAADNPPVVGDPNGEGSSDDEADPAAGLASGEEALDPAPPPAPSPAPTEAPAPPPTHDPVPAPATGIPTLPTEAPATVGPFPGESGPGQLAPPEADYDPIPSVSAPADTSPTPPSPQDGNPSPEKPKKGVILKDSEGNVYDVTGELELSVPDAQK